jgi:hypothetical protein
MTYASLNASPSRAATRSGYSRLPGPHCGPARVRNGTIYLAVLGVALIVSVFGAAAIHIARIELHHAVSADEMARARLAAQSGIEYAISMINTYDGWREICDNGDEITFANADPRNKLAGTGAFSLTLTDNNGDEDDELGDGDLDDNDQDAVTLRSVGTAGGATSVVEVLLMPAGLGLDCLSSGLHGDARVKFDNDMTMPSVSSNSNIEVKSGKTLTVAKYAWARGPITGTINPNTPTTRLPNQPISREMPDPDRENVFRYYMDNGTWIDVDSLSGDDTIRDVLLSPTNNPYGSGETNSQGIYIIDCDGEDITLRDCRIVGTLVLLNAGSGTHIKDCILMEPAIPNFPVLMVEGSMEMDWDFRNDVEENNLGINLNPLGIPLGGIVDNLLGGSWDSGITGLVYVTGNLLVKNQEPMIDGVVVADGTVTVESRLSLTHDSTFYNTPPLGFAAGPQMQIVPGTWKRVEDPNP